MEDYPINFIKSYLWGKFIRKREKTYNPRQEIWLRERYNYFFTCDGCGRIKMFYATYLKENSTLYGEYCWVCWKKLTGANERAMPSLSGYIFDNEDFIEYLDISHALEKIKFTARQKHVLHFYMMEHSERMIADRLEISRKSVRIHLNRAFEKIFEYLNGCLLPKTPT